MLSALLLTVGLWAQPGCVAPGYPLDADFTRAQPLTGFVEQIAAPAGASPDTAVQAKCLETKALAPATGWWRVRLISAGSGQQDLLMQVPARAMPSVCVHWPQRTGFVSECVDRNQHANGARYFQFAVPSSMNWAQPVLIEVRRALVKPAPLSLIAQAASERLEQRVMLGTGLLVGLMTAVAIICVLAYIVVRRSGYLFAAGMTLFTCLAWVGLSGRGVALPGPLGNWLSNSGALVAMQLGWLTTLAYTTAYLNLRNAGGLQYRAMLGLLGGHGLGLLAAMIKPTAALWLFPPLALLSVGALCVLLVWQISRGSERAGYLFGALALLMLGTSMTALSWFSGWANGLRVASALIVVGLVVCPAVLVLGIYRRYGRLERERNQAEQALAAQQRLTLLRASYCRVTGLPLRPKLAELFTRMTQEADPSNVQLGIFLLHADNLSLIRQQYGRQTLEEVISVLGSRLRASLDDKHLLGRLENWELAVIVPATAGDGLRERLYQAAESISDCLRAPIDVGGHTVTLSVSVGMAIWPNHGSDFEELMLRCDSALYEAQRGGGNAFKVYSEEQHIHRTHQFQRISDLKRAMDRNELELYYQPVHHALTGAVTSVEALIRWHHPEFGLLTPGSFVPLAEDSELILDLGYWTLHAATHDLAWFAEGGMELPVAINVTPRQFAARGFVGHIRDIVEHSAFAARLLRLEITENSLIDNWDKTSFALTELRELGVQVFVDDFGVGYSSLNYVRALPIEGLKIDLSFVRDLGKSSQDEAVVSTIIRLARSLNLKVIAEGVETQYQRDFLRIEGCDRLQGHLFSEPLPREQLLDYVQAQHPSKRARA